MARAWIEVKIRASVDAGEWLGMLDVRTLQGARLLLSGVAVEDQVEIASMVRSGGGMVSRVTQREGCLALEARVPVPCEE